MNILFIGYWNADDPLTSSTIIPHLRLLRKHKEISKLVFCSIQRENYSITIRDHIESLGIVFEPIFSRNLFLNLLNKFYDFISFPKDLIEIINKYDITEIIARGALAGSLALKVHELENIPFSVESLEPHADYMRSTGVWNTWDPRYIMQKRWEKKMHLKAKYLFPVTKGYKSHLIKVGINKSKIHVSPCAVNSNKFIIDTSEKAAIRAEIGIKGDSIVGVYAGKFGGLYYKSEAFRLFKDIFEIIPNFHLLLLSPDSDEFINNSLDKDSIDKNRVSHTFVSHNEVPKYLNIADFAIATYKTTNVSKYLSPVKVAEYWACGLPVLISKNVGDENYFIEQQELGLTIDVMNVFKRKECLERFYSKLADYDKESIRMKGIKLRNFKNIEEGYSMLIN